MKKPKNLTATQRKLAAEWEEIKARHSKPLERGFRGASPPSVPVLTRKEQPRYRIPSLVTPGHSTSIKQAQLYTGDSMLGISTLHKSNSVPVFSQSDAIDIARMRR